MRTLNNIFIAFFITMAIVGAVSFISGAYHQVFMAGIAVMMLLVLISENQKTSKS